MRREAIHDRVACPAPVSLPGEAGGRSGDRAGLSHPFCHAADIPWQERALCRKPPQRVEHAGPPRSAARGGALGRDGSRWQRVSCTTTRETRGNGTRTGNWEKGQEGSSRVLGGRWLWTRRAASPAVNTPGSGQTDGRGRAPQRRRVRKMLNGTTVPKKARQAARGQSVAAKAARAEEGAPRLPPPPAPPTATDRAGPGSRRSVPGAERLPTGGTGD